MKTLPAIDDENWFESFDSIQSFAKALLAWFAQAEPWLRKNRHWSQFSYMRTMLASVVVGTATLQELRSMPLNMSVLRRVVQECEQRDLHRPSLASLN